MMKSSVIELSCLNSFIASSLLVQQQEARPSRLKTPANVVCFSDLTRSDGILLAEYSTKSSFIDRGLLSGLPVESAVVEESTVSV